MKILITLLLGLSMLSSAFAENTTCYEKLTSGGTKDSQSFRLYEDEVGNLDDIGIEYALASVTALMNKLGCQGQDQAIVDSTQAACAEIIPGNSESEVCYLATTLGYFIVSVDYLGWSNLTFNRYD
jgi:hypothetical protein